MVRNWARINHYGYPKEKLDPVAARVSAERVAETTRAVVLLSRWWRGLRAQILWRIDVPLPRGRSDCLGHQRRSVVRPVRDPNRPLPRHRHGGPTLAHALHHAPPLGTVQSQNRPRPQTNQRRLEWVRSTHEFLLQVISQWQQLYQYQKTVGRVRQMPQGMYFILG